MAAWRGVFLALTLLILAARVFTGIVYESGDPTTYLVLKHRPSLSITQENAADRPVRERFTILDGDENALFYQAPYTAFMRWAFLLAGLFGASAMLLPLLGRRRG